MQPYKIEKGVPLTKPATAHGSSSTPTRVTITLNKLEKGDSFLITSPLEALKAGKIVRDFNARERKRGGRHRVFVTRKDGNGLRVWRTK